MLGSQNGLTAAPQTAAKGPDAQSNAMQHMMTALKAYFAGFQHGARHVSQLVAQHARSRVGVGYSDDPNADSGTVDFARKMMSGDMNPDTSSAPSQPSQGSEGSDAGAQFVKQLLQAIFGMIEGKG